MAQNDPVSQTNLERHSQARALRRRLVDERMARADREDYLMARLRRLLPEHYAEIAALADRLDGGGGVAS